MGREKERLRIVIDSNVLIGALIRDNSFKDIRLNYFFNSLDIFNFECTD